MPTLKIKISFWKDAEQTRCEHHSFESSYSKQITFESVAAIIDDYKNAILIKNPDYVFMQSESIIKN